MLCIENSRLSSLVDYRFSALLQHQILLIFVIVYIFSYFSRFFLPFSQSSFIFFVIFITHIHNCITQCIIGSAMYILISGLFDELLHFSSLIHSSLMRYVGYFSYLNFKSPRVKIYRLYWRHFWRDRCDFTRNICAEFSVIFLLSVNFSTQWIFAHQMNVNWCSATTSWISNATSSHMTSCSLDNVPSFFLKEHKFHGRLLQLYCNDSHVHAFVHPGAYSSILYWKKPSSNLGKRHRLIRLVPLFVRSSGQSLDVWY